MWQDDTLTAMKTCLYVLFSAWRQCVCCSIWCRLEDMGQDMIEQRAELQREQSVGEGGREGV